MAIGGSTDCNLPNETIFKLRYQVIKHEVIAMKEAIGNGSS